MFLVFLNEYIMFAVLFNWVHYVCDGQIMNNAIQIQSHYHTYYRHHYWLVMKFSEIDIQLTVVTHY